jgi:hypothetical protein
VVLSATLLLASCSSIKLGYNNADTLLVYALDSYVDLDAAQEKLARERVRALHAWHRTTQLAGYADLLARAQTKVAGTVSAADVLEFQNTANAKLAAVGIEAAPDLAQLAASLSPAQIERMTERLAKDASKARREAVRFEGTDSLDDRVERYVEGAERWFGALTGEQRDIVRRSLASRPNTHSWWVEERERRQRVLAALIDRIRTEQPDHGTATTWLRRYFAELVDPTDPEVRGRTLAFRSGNAALIAELINSATPAQRTTLTKKLRGYADDFAALAAESAPRVEQASAPAQ